MISTAKHFNGQFLGFVDDISSENQNNEFNTDKISTEETATISLRLRRALWKCNKGHQFTEFAGNIRRPIGGKRKCSWCKICRKNGIDFEWNIK